MAFFPHYVTLWYSHGPVSGQTNRAAEKAETARDAAGATIAKVATALVEQLHKASGVYAATDEGQRQILSQQMHP
jgi:hypothetical protein